MAIAVKKYDDMYIQLNPYAMEYEVSSEIQEILDQILEALNEAKADDAIIGIHTNANNDGMYLRLLSNLDTWYSEKVFTYSHLVWEAPLLADDNECFRLDHSKRQKLSMHCAVQSVDADEDEDEKRIRENLFDNPVPRMKEVINEIVEHRTKMINKAKANYFSDIIDMPESYDGTGLSMM